MKKAFVPSIRVQNVTPVFAKDSEGNIQPVFDHRGRQQFNMPKPVREVIHFNSEASKRKFMKLKNETAESVRNGSVPVDIANKLLGDALRKAAHKVPVYKGMSARDYYPFNQTARMMRERQREALKKQMEDWAALNKQKWDSKEFMTIGGDVYKGEVRNDIKQFGEYPV